MQRLAFPSYRFTTKSNKNKRYKMDPIRKKFIILTPEEWVRQHVLADFIAKGISKTRICVEKQFMVMGQQKRFDILVTGKNTSFELLVECKAPAVAITQQTFDQIAQYQLSLNATYLMLTNGIQHIYCQIDNQSKSYKFINDFPDNLLSL